MTLQIISIIKDILQSNLRGQTVVVKSLMSPSHINLHVSQILAVKHFQAVCKDVRYTFK